MSLALGLPDPPSTQALGTRLAGTMPAPAVVFLRGDLGAGKSALARAMLVALGASGPIRSPTYTLVERHALAHGEAAHLDLYRIAQAAELEFLGLQDLLPDLQLLLVEWPERGEGALPHPDLTISLDVEGDGRLARLEAGSALGVEWLRRLPVEPNFDV